MDRVADLPEPGPSARVVQLLVVDRPARRVHQQLDPRPPRLRGFRHVHRPVDGDQHGVRVRRLQSLRDRRQGRRTRLNYVPMMFGGAGRPTGQAGRYLYKRTGAEPVTTTAFVVSSNPGA